jgi:molecular chaperone DnaJ
MAVMSEKRDYYEVLGVARTATTTEIAAAYRKLAIKYHPDHSKAEDAADKFKECSEAFEVLNNSDKRAVYDQYGHAGLQRAGAGPQFHDVEDIFDAFSDMFGGGMFGDIFGNRRRSRRPRRGADVRCDVTLDLEEAAFGVTRTVELERNETCNTCNGSGAAPGSAPQQCPRCHGHGQIVQSAGILRVQTTCPQCSGAGSVITDPCTKCRGRGSIPLKRTLDVAIPAGVDEGMQVRLTGEGEPSPNGGPPGDAYCFIHVRKHSIFQRDGIHLILRLPISYGQAALGATVEAPSLRGREEIHIPAGTQSGEVFRLRGKGIADPRGGRTGDLLVQTYIEVPRKLSKEQQELLRKLAEVEHREVAPERRSFMDKIKDYFSTRDETESQARKSV